MKIRCLLPATLALTIFGAANLNADPLPYPIDAYQNPGISVPPSGNSAYWIGNPNDPTGNWGFSDPSPETLGNSSWWQNGAISLTAPENFTIVLGSPLSPYTATPYSSTIRLDMDRTASNLQVLSGNFGFDLAGNTLRANTLTIGAVVGTSPRLHLSGNGTFQLGGLSLGSVSSGNRFGGPGSFVTWDSNTTIDGSISGTVTVGGTGATDNVLHVSEGQNYTFSSATINVASTTAPSNNRIEVDGGTLTFGSLTLNGGFNAGPEPENRSNNVFRVTNGGVVNTSSGNWDVYAGSELLVENGGIVNKSSGNLNIEIGGRFGVSGEGSVFGAADYAGNFTMRDGVVVSVDGGTLTTGTPSLLAGASLSVTNGGNWVKNATSAFTISGSLTLDGGSMVSAGGAMTISPGTGSTGLTLSNGGSLMHGGTITFSAGTSPLVITPGVTLQNTGSLVPPSGNNTVQAGGNLIAGSFTSAGDSTQGVSSANYRVIVEEGGNFQVGSILTTGNSSSFTTIPVQGTFTLLNGFTTDRQFMVAPGTRMIFGGGSYSPSNLYLNSTVVGDDILRGALGGTGSIGADDEFSSRTLFSRGGEINPGTDDEPGVLSFARFSFEVRPSQFVFDIFGYEAAEYDQVLHSRTSQFEPDFATLGAKIKVNLRNDFEPIDIDVFQLFHTNTGKYAGLGNGPIEWDLPELSGGLGWDTGSLSIDGTLRVYDTTATGNNSKLYLGAETPVPANGASFASVVNNRVIKDSVVEGFFPLNNAGTSGTSYSVTVEGDAISNSETIGTVWALGTSIHARLDTSSLGLKIGTVTVRNLAPDYSGTDPSSGSRDADDTIILAASATGPGNTTVVENRIITADGDLNLGKLFVGQEGNVTDFYLFGGEEQYATSVSRTTSYVEPPNVQQWGRVGLRGAASGADVGNFTGINQKRRFEAYPYGFNASGIINEIVNVAEVYEATPGSGTFTRLLTNGEQASVGATVTTNVPVRMLAEVYEKAVLSFDAPTGPGFASGESIPVRNAAAPEGGLRAAARISTVQISPNWNVSGFDNGGVISGGAVVNGIATYNGPIGINGSAVQGSITLSFVHDDTSIIGATLASNNPASITIPLRHVFDGSNVPEYGDSREAVIPGDTSFAGLGLNSLGGTVASLLDGSLSEESRISIGFNEQDQDDSLIGDILELDIEPLPSPGYLAYWNFNSQTFSNNAPGTSETPLAVAADGFGEGTFSFAGWGGQVGTNTNGSFYNSVDDNPAGRVLLLNNNGSAANGTYIDVVLDLTNLKDVEISYATWRQNSNGFSSNQWSWSTDGENFVNFGTPIVPPTSITSLGDIVRLAVPSDVDGAASVILRYTLSGAQAESGLNYIDNFVVSATPLVVSDPFAVVSLSYDPTDLPAGQTPVLVVDTTVGWINAVLENSAGTPTFVSGAYEAGTHGIGTYGHDAATNTVWAVIDYLSGSFSVQVPNKVAALSGLTVDPGLVAPAYEGGSTTLFVAVPDATTEIRITPTALSPLATLTVNSVTVASGEQSAPIALSNPTTTIPVIVTAGDGVTQRTYTVTVTRTSVSVSAVTQAATDLTTSSATLNGLVTSNGAVAGVVFEYGPTASYGFEVKATPSGVDGSTATSVSAPLAGLSPGQTIHYRVKAQNGVSSATGDDMILVVPFSGNGALSKLEFAGSSFTPLYPLVPSFHPGVLEYSTDAPTLTSGTVRAVLSDPEAVLRINGTIVPSGIPSANISLAVGLTTIPVEVTAKDGSKTTYVIRHGRPGTPTLSVSAASNVVSTSATINGSITPNGRNVTPRFQFVQSTSTSQPSATVWNTATVITPEPEENAEGYTAVTYSANVSGLLPNTRYWYRMVGTWDTTTTTSTGVNFVTPASNNANLTFVKFNGGATLPTFDPDVTAYTLKLPVGTTSVTVKPFKADTNATVRVNGTVVATNGTSSAITVSNGTVITVLNTAQNGTTTKTYTFTASVTAPTVGTLASQVSGIPISSGTPLYSRALQQPDGKILLAGTFNYTVNGVVYRNLIRMLPDGTVDEAFTENLASANMTVSTVSALALQLDGKIVFAQTSTMKRLNGDGTLDSNFVFTAPTGWTGISNIRPLPDGKLVVGDGGTTGLNRVVRLNSDGSVDLTLAPIPNSGPDGLRDRNLYWVDSLPDGKIMIGGSFRNSTTDGFVYRYTAEGVLDAVYDEDTAPDGFNQGRLGNETGHHINLLQDGRFFIGGRIGTLTPNTNYTGYFRYLANGFADMTYNPRPPGLTTSESMGTNANTASIVLLHDQRAILFGTFTTVNGQAITNLAFLDADGAPDTANFKATVANNTLNFALPLQDGRILLGGNFTSFNGQTRAGLAWLENGLPTDRALTISDGSKVVWHRSGNQLDMHDVVIESSTNGVDWTAHGAVERTEEGWESNGPMLPASGYVRARGRTTVVKSGGFDHQMISCGGASSTPVVETLPAVGLTLNGRVNGMGLETAVTFEYGTDTNFGNTIEVSPVTGAYSSNVSASLTNAGLTPGETYYYRVTAVNSSGTIHGETLTFVAANVALTGLSVSGGALEPEFNSEQISYTVRLPATATTFTVTPTAANPANTIQVGSNVVESGMPSPDINVSVGSTGQDVNVVVTSEDGTATRTYSVNLRRDPTLVTVSASNIRRDGATLRGLVTPNGPTNTLSFEYGLDTNYGQTVASTPASGSGTPAVAASATLTGLLPGTTYHYRIVSNNGIASFSGEDLTFTTLAESEVWRIEAFGSKLNTGVGADSATPMRDRIANLMKFATGQRGDRVGQEPGEILMDEEKMYFVYVRNKGAKAELTYRVEWNDTLATTGWSTAGVVETIVEDEGENEVVTVELPRGTGVKRFVRLSVQRQ